MERITVTMHPSDVDLFERKRNEMGMSKSSYIRYLIAEHEKALPPFLKYKEIIKELAEINTSLKEIVINEKISITDKMQLCEKIDQLTETMRDMK